MDSTLRTELHSTTHSYQFSTMATSNPNQASPNKPSFLIPFLAFVTMLFMFPNTVKSAQSVSFTFTKFDSDQKDLIFQGHAISSSNVIQLTKLDSNGNPVSTSVGRVLYSAPVRLWESNTVVSTFDTTFTFKISTPYTTPADGFTFFLAPNDTAIPPYSAGKLLGLFSNLNALRNSTTSNQTTVDFKAVSNNVVAVEFDTYPNDNIGDPRYKHIGIDVNSIRSKATVAWDWQNGKAATAHISYNSASKRLSVTTFYPGSKAVTLSHDVELTTVLPQWIRVGFSASTGAERQRNTLLSWSFSSSLKNNVMEEEKEDMNIASVV
ncbi:unnamed protein product [Sphenostylis stenocarpa]|uniref:Legume lectin domain-containing protein n=1 Tax=Sphenostylis stenocarpa TaxID=92480 RepID=A0AA86W2J8_9FABA|nr:unnamed protein product [Sphenostylis stenocarpa]